jgi:hypothetical protein
MIIRFKSIVFMTALAVSAQAQQSKPRIVIDSQTVSNDDGGQAFIIERNMGPLTALGATPKNTIAEPQQYSIFVGKSWADASLHERETTLGSLLANVSDDSTIEVLSALGIKNRFGPAINNEQTDVTAGVFRDLDAQRVLRNLISSGEIGMPNARTIYVVFLDSSLQSTLGTLTSGKHYVAYYSAFTVDGARVRYVVVPFESDPSKGCEIALRALIASATTRSPLAK